MVPHVSDHHVVVVSNRGPLAFTVDDAGALIARRGAGGLVSSLGPAVAATDATWIACALSDADRRAAAGGAIDADGFRVRTLDVAPDLYRQYYDVVSNATLWFLNHGLFDLPRRPRIDRRWMEAWDAYRKVNVALADFVIDEADTGATVLVHDYHLSLIGARLAKERPDLRSVYFHHTPFCDPTTLRVLPEDVRVELLEGLAGNRACGFHSPRWAANFEACCDEVLGRVPKTYVAPAAPDADDLRAVASGLECDAALESLDAAVGDRLVIARVDRIEPSKNIVRGFLAYEDLLRDHPQWRERVVFVAYIYPSRQSMPEYQAYDAEVRAVVDRINAQYSAPGWTPILLDTRDDFPRSLAALRRYDVLLVNPVRDGLNLVAKEGPLVNERDGVVLLSPEAGVWDELSDAAIAVNPFDVGGTAAALDLALNLDPVERHDRWASLREAAERRSPQDWFDDQLAAGRD
jgi:trehalose 6-phosphate synthase